MRDPREWDEEQLLNLPVGEFDWLEIKRRRGLDLTLPNVDEHQVRQNLSKALSAFANSGGGTLIYGLCDPETSVAVDDGGIALYLKGSTTTREWLEDIIPNLVDLPLTKFNVYAVHRKSDTSQISEGRGILVVHIGDSDQAPHQAWDRRYYARIGGKSRPIGHKLVTDILNRVKHPKIQIEVKIIVIREQERGSVFDGIRIPGSSYSPAEREIIERVELIVSTKNVGRVLARFMNCFVMVPEELLDDHYQELYEVEEINGGKYVTMSESNTKQDIVGYESGLAMTPKYGPSWFDPILPGLSHVWSRRVRFEGGFDRSEFPDLKIYWEIFADNAPTEQGEIRIDEVEVVYEDKTK